MTDANKAEVQSHCEALEKSLCKAGLRASADMRMNVTVGWKFNAWEQKGVPVRVEIGPRDMKNQQVSDSLFFCLTLFPFFSPFLNLYNLLLLLTPISTTLSIP